MGGKQEFFVSQLSEEQQEQFARVQAALAQEGKQQPPAAQEHRDEQPATAA